MIAIDDTITAALAGGAIVAFSMSGGKDSAAAALAAGEYLDQIGHPKANRIAIHADLGLIEWPQTTAFVELCAARLALPLTIVSRAQGGLIDRWHDRFERALARYVDLETYQLIGPWSSSSLRFCTSELKAAPISRRLAELYPGKTIISVIGIRREESTARAATPISKAARPAKSRTTIINWHPIAEWKENEVFACHDQNDFPLHVAYTRYGLSRLSCAYCVLASRANLERAAASGCNEDSLHALISLELRSTFPFQLSAWLADTTAGAHAFAPGRVTAAKARQRKRIEAEAALPTDLRYVKGWPPRVPTPAEAATIRDTRALILDQHNLPIKYPSAEDIRARFAELHNEDAFRHAH